MAAKAMVTGLVLSLCFVSSLAKLPRVEHPPMADGSLSLLVVGDWGRRGLYNQTEVATQMGRIGEQLDIDFVVSTGDNFYEDGLTGVDDGAFQDSFTNVYTAKSLQKPWYSVLGNHDYRGDVIAQLSPVLKGIDSRWVCMRSFVLDAVLHGGHVAFRAPLLDEAQATPLRLERGGSPRPVPRKHLEGAEIKKAQNSLVLMEFPPPAGGEDLHSIGHGVLSEAVTFNEERECLYK
ncbi:hypothetical protein Taro_002535 [Colocasia esculenta]|uniref:Calcineurin-like phosphoesterase domain-containing protein n=1 Tax=Colocasia esculenta TaxID=4460 RepID=A0A843TGS3_COLES|nr:hypothetical protein [Colocasia esculenta]